ncbi:hypothetical protein WMY93_010327 [Mugilogobius chulae]|uniref:Leucine-rich repeat, immunoglobulin-like domain and transmembrane domain-containing protein 1 n=1 Tax=Mugilogobius chulae TaxID=88201 RepID=A0AAW0P779_9GOBI
MRLTFAFCLTLALRALSAQSCPIQCSCFFHKLSDGSKARSVLCNDPEITVIPSNFPTDTSKLRIEKTAISRISADNFHYLNNLFFLWMSFNSISSLNVDSFRGLINLNELRLDGNAIVSFPWESLNSMPNLRLLDLHNNKINSIPSEAVAFMKNITYLDLSTNNLGTLPGNVLAMWLNVKPTQDTESKVILGLHDNPWTCDCRLFDLVQFQKSPWSSVALIDTRLKCSSPDSLAGVLFSEAELQKCQGPRVHTAVARVRSSLGNNVLLRCGLWECPSRNCPGAEPTGRRSTGQVIQQEISKEGIIWSILSVPAVSYKDSGKYVCKATNFVGTADALISLVITDSLRSEEVGGASKRNRGGRKNGIGRAAYQEKLIARYVPPPTNAPNRPIIEPLNKNAVTGNNIAANASSLQAPEKRIVRSVKVIGDTDHTVSLNWRAPTATNTTEFSVLYAIFGERDMRRINVGAGKNRITIDGLVPKTKYIACICVKGLIPKKEQCVIFSTDEAAALVARKSSSTLW